jgi:hypothetical protein
MPEMIDLSDIDGAYGTEPPRGLVEMNVSCLQCVGEYLLARDDREAGVLHDGAEPVIPEIRSAVTLAPSWQQTEVLGQLIMACVALPSCLEHLQTKKESTVERATRSGLQLGRPG